MSRRRRSIIGHRRRPTRCGRGPAESAPSGSCPSRRASRPRASAPRWTVPTCDVAEPARQPLPRSRERGARARERPRRAPCRPAPTPPCPGDPSTETRGGASAASARDTTPARSKSSSVSPGNPTMTSEPIEACGHARADAVDERRVVRERVGPPHRREHRGRSRAAAAGGSAARSGPTPRRGRRSRGVQSIGSSELMRKQRRRPGALRVADRRARAAARRATIGGVEIAAVRAEVHAGQRDLLEAGSGDALDFAQTRRRAARCAAAPRVVGMMQ